MGHLKGEGIEIDETKIEIIGYREWRGLSREYKYGRNWSKERANTEERAMKSNIEVYCQPNEIKQMNNRAHLM